MDVDGAGVGVDAEACCRAGSIGISMLDRHVNALRLRKAASANTHERHSTSARVCLPSSSTEEFEGSLEPSWELNRVLFSSFLLLECRTTPVWSSSSLSKSLRSSSESDSEEKGTRLLKHHVWDKQVCEGVSTSRNNFTLNLHVFIKDQRETWRGVLEMGTFGVI